MRFAALLLAAIVMLGAAPSSADAETRTLKLYYLHTREKVSITYKKNGRYLSDGLKKVNWALRDWRRNEPTKMDPRLLDLIWEVYRKSGSRDYIHVISGYRSPATNSMLRKRGRGVAKKSQHMLGRAMDFYLPDVKLSKLRRIGLQMQIGGVGYYPRSGSPFVHLDVGNVRHWPRMNRKQLLAVFPNGKTLHVPSDGKPLPGYTAALASYKKRKKSGSIVVASASSSSSSSRSSKAVTPRDNDRGFLSTFFGGGADEEEETSTGFATKPSAKPAKEKAAPVPAAPVAEPEKKQSIETLVAALSPKDMPLPQAAPRANLNAGIVADLSAAEKTPNETVELAFAQIPTPSRRPEYLVAGSETNAVPSDVIAELLKRANEREQAKPEYVTALAPTPRPSSLASEGSKRRERVTKARLNSEITVASVQQMPDMLPAPEIKGATAPKSGRLHAPATKVSIRARLQQTALLDESVRIAPKQAKPDLSDVEPATRPVVLPIDNREAEWAFRASSVPEIRSAALRAEAELRKQPTVVYKLGFGDAPAHQGNVNRFTGNAVTFLSIARFSSDSTGQTATN